jgi:hypothetical protein
MEGPLNGQFEHWAYDMVIIWKKNEHKIKKKITIYMFYCILKTKFKVVFNAEVSKNVFKKQR